MRAASQSVQDPDAEGGLCLHVKMCCGRSVRMRVLVVCGPMVDVDVRVAPSVMLVLVHVDPLAGRLPDAPHTDRDEHEAYQPFAPARQLLDGENFAQEERRDSHDHHATGMPEAPEETGLPGALLPIGGEGRNGRQVVRPGEHVDRSRRQAGDDGSDHGVPVLSADGGGP